MKHFTKIGLLACLLAVTTLHAQDFEWAKSFGGTTHDIGNCITLDALGNVYTAGSFSGTVDFDPGVGIFNLTSAGSSDIFVQKIDASGNFLWVKSFGSTSNDVGNSISVDVLGNVYTTGGFQGIVDFDPGAGTYNLSSPGSYDVFVQKMDASGNFLWAKSFKGSADNIGNSISVDTLGNVYTTGSFNVSADFDPGIGISNRTSVGDQDIFVQKMDASGNFLWAKTFGGIYDDVGYSISVDVLGNVYTTGKFRETIDFDPGGGTSNMTTEGFDDIFVQKMNTSGNFLWAKTFGGTSDDGGRSISTDALGNVYITGYFQLTVDFNPGGGTSNLTSAGLLDIFVQKMDASGNFLWAKSFGGTFVDSGNSISVDDLGNVYTTGYFYETVDFDPGTGIYNLISAGNRDIFVQKMDASGNFLWTRSFGSTFADGGNSISVDALGNAYTAGFFYGTIDFDPGVGTSNLTSTGDRDIFVQKMSECITTTGTDVQTACGSYTWIDGNTYTTSNSTATHTLTNTAGCDSVVTLNLIINNSNTGTDVQTACGSYTWIDGNTYTASNSTATHTLTNTAGCDSVVTLNLVINNSNTGTDVQTACGSYTWIDGNTYTTSNSTATHTLINTAGCDSVVTLNLVINNSNTGTDVQTACGSYTWIDGNTYTTSNSTATHTLTNTAGCDSVVTLNLNINNSNTGTDVQTACGSYTWIDGNTYTTSNSTATHTLTNTAGCDSVVTLNLVINNSNTGTDVQTACGSYTWIDGNTYTTSNSTATHTLINTAGCDSVVTLNLVINSVSDVTTSVSGLTITATNTSSSYQWLDCDNNYAVINDEINQTFTTSLNGSYAVELTEGGCVDTSNCIVITSVGVVENNFGDRLVVYPNPTNGNFSVDLGENYDDIKINITDMNGRIIQSSEYNNYQILDLTITEPTGIYLMVIESAEQRTVIQLVKE